MDKIAETLAIDPAELRKKHLLPSNSLTVNWLRVGTMGLGKCIDKVVEGSNWKERFRKLPADVLETTGEFFSTLRVRAAAGRTFDSSDADNNSIGTRSTSKVV